MPHQLRRIIGINIRNPKDGLPSGRIVSMDPRGGVLAIGVNGVGKTTFLRLLPLFYGATVQQIMRGTGHSKMVAHVLPDASSAIAFEYERETAQDLRTVVVYCRPNEDAPDFYIVMGGYREEYFYNEQREFVTRDEFKGRVEAMDVAVTRRLALHQYRSVILSENLPTKEGRELRSLSALHSLGPKPMRHLDQIAAAMANEKISFRDLQSIVIDRVSDADAGGAEVTQRTLKKNKGDVVSWLDNYKHLSKVMRLEPKARELAQRVTTIRGHHLALCGLHIAVKEAYRQTESLLVEKNERLRELDREIASRGEALDQAVSTLTDQHTEASRFHSDKNREVEEAEGTLAFFTKLGIEKLIAEEDAEGSIKQDQAAATSELAPLEAQAGSLRDSLRQRTEEARSAHIKHREGIDRRLVNASAEERAQHTRLSEMRDAAEAALASPARLQEIGVERLDLVRAQERHRMLSQRPTEDDETHEAVESSRQALADCESVLSSAQSGRRDQEAALAQAGKTRDGALEKVAQVDASITANERDISLLEQQLTPARGSLLAFLRESPDEAWAAGAKVLDPALLARTDLNPRFGLQGTDLLQPSDVSVNALVIDTGGLAKPAWIDMADLQLQMKSLEDRAKKLGKERTDAGALAKKASTARTEAAAMLATLQQTEVMAQTARDNAAHALKRWEGHARVLREACKVQADADLKKIAGKLVTLQFEEDGLKSDDTRARAALRADFAGQFRRLDADAKAGRERLEQERKDAATQLQEQIARITADVDREAAGRGVDTKRMAGLQARIDAARTRLDAIASHGHHVRAWRKFQRDVAPLMEAARLDRDRRHTLMVSVKRQLATAEAERVAYSTASRTERVGLESVITTQQGWIDALGLLLKGPLHRFLTHVPESLHIDWSLDSLAESVRNRLFALDTDLETLRTETRKLREVMVERPGGPQDFLLLREREHTDPQRLLEHQGAVEKAESVAAWFDLMAYGPYVDGMNKEMDSIFSIASIFVQDLESFDRRVITFNHELQRALQETATFARFQDLSVSVRSGVGKINYLETLREMRDTSHSRGSVTRSVSIVDRELPREEDVRLMERFHGLLPDDGLFRVNLSDQVRLECSLIENGKRRVITNEEEFRGVSSNGNTALIIAMFLMGFVQMIRGKGSQVRVTWIADEVGRFDIGNLSAFLQTLDAHNIDVISASPSIDPEIARHFSRLCVFEGNGSIQTSTTEITELDLEESAYAQA